MVQIIAIVLLFVLGKLAYDYFVKGPGAPLPGGRSPYQPPRRKPQRTGDVIDISNTWADSSSFTYRSREYPLNNKEYAIYNLLRELIDTERHLICPKLRLSDVVSANAQDENYAENSARLRERSLDLAILNPDDLKLQLAVCVESSDDQRKKQLDDQQREKTLTAARIPFLKLDPRDLDQDALKEELFRAGLKLKA